MENRNNKKAILYMTELALLSALVVVLQLLGTFVKIGPLPMSLVLVPIVIGACLLGIKAGAILGLVFGIVTAVMGITGADGFSLILFEARPFWFIVLCLLKATAAGFGAGVIYKALENPLGKNNKTLQTVIASVSAPILLSSFSVPQSVVPAPDSFLQLHVQLPLQLPLQKDQSLQLLRPIPFRFRLQTSLLYWIRFPSQLLLQCRNQFCPLFSPFLQLWLLQSLRTKPFQHP